MKEHKGVWASLAALLPALVLAATGWMEAKAATAKKYDALESYREYIEDRMERDAALEKALHNCMALLPARPAGATELEEALGPVLDAGPSSYAMGPPPAADVDLDEIAEEWGYEQKVAPK